MFLVEIEPTGVKQVSLKCGGSEVQEDLCLATWPLVRKHLNRLNKALKSVNKTLSTYEGQGNETQVKQV
jgi:hypothetical protein